MRPLRSLTGGMLMLFLSFVTGCAMSASGGWGVSDPIKYEMQTAMKAAPCTPSPIINNEASINVSNGWTRLDPTGSMPTCPTKSLTAFHCTKSGGCGELVWTGQFKGASDMKPRNFVVDVARGGKVIACVLPARFFGVHVECKKQTLEATTSDQRFIVSGSAISADVTDLSLFLEASEGTHVLQINQLEPR